MVTDAANNKVLLFGGRIGTTPLNDFWEFDAVALTWREIRPATRPPARFAHAMAFDSSRGRLVLYGGDDGSVTLLGDTWEWNGTVWAQIVTAASPGRLSEHAMAFDAPRNLIVLDGGLSQPVHAIGPSRSTFEYDGTNWFDRTPGLGGGQPNPRARHGMAFSPAHSACVILVPFLSTGLSPNTMQAWSWTGTAWSFLGSDATVNPTVNFGLASFDFTAGVVMSGGNMIGQGPAFSPPPSPPQTGNTFGVPFTLPATPPTLTRINPQTDNPPPFVGACMTADPTGGALLFADGLWRLRRLANPNLLDWTLLTPSDTSAPKGPVAFDPSSQSLLLVGSHVRGPNTVTTPPNTLVNDSWSRNAVGLWSRITPTGNVAPNPQNAPRMVFDRANSNTVLVENTGATWIWNGSSWTLQANAASSGPVLATAFDVNLNAVVAMTAGGNQLEAWNGTSWTQIPGVVSGFQAMAFDELLGVLVLVDASRQTTHFTPVSGFVLQVPPAPPGVQGASPMQMTFDNGTQHTVLVGTGTTSGAREVWVWNGTSWQQRPSVAPAPPVEQLVGDSVRRRPVAFAGGGFTSLSLSELRFDFELLEPANSPIVVSVTSEPQVGGTLDISYANPMNYSIVFVSASQPLTSPVSLTDPALCSSPQPVWFSGTIDLQLAITANPAVVSAPIPNLAALLDAPVTVQAAVASTNAAGSCFDATRGTMTRIAPSSR
jgi:hypothetical protein